MFPERLLEFVEEGLVDYVAMDIKVPKEKYPEVVGFKIDVSKIEESMLIVARLENYEFRTTVVPGLIDPEAVRRICQWVNGVISERPKNYFLQGFQNNGDFINDKYKKYDNVLPDKIKPLAEVAEEYFLNVGVRG
jgi:pyruvate formate lyase activating enzyme